MDYMLSERRAATITARITHEDRAIIRLAADRCGTTLSAYAAAAISSEARRELGLTSAEDA